MNMFKFEKVVLPETMVLAGYGGGRYGVNNRYLTKDGKPWLPASGEFHYSRVPEEMWENELDKMKNAGLSIISTYIFWIHHEEVEGSFCWDGNRNLGKFIDICHQKGLEITLRIGPWVHGECRNGGFPDWLLQKCGDKVRCDAMPYMAYVKSYYEQIVAHLQGRRLFSVQIENELVSNPEHLMSLYDLAIECGFRAAFFTATAWGFDMSRITQKMLPTFGGYPEQPWNQSMGPSWPNPHFFFTGIRSDGNIGNDLQPVQNVEQDETVPYFTCETGPGVQPCAHRRPVISAQDALSMALTTLGDGCNWLGFYMFHGGRNPIGILSTMQESRDTGYPNDCPIISYDFQAPVGEAGYMRESYYRLQSVCVFLQSYGEILAPMIPVFPNLRPDNLEDTRVLRCCLRSNGKEGFLFVNNHHHGKKLPEHRDVDFRIEFETGTVEICMPVIPADSGFLLPVNLKLSNTLTLEYALAQPLKTEKGSWTFEVISGVEPLFVFADGRRRVIEEQAEIDGVKIYVRKNYADSYREEETEGNPVSFKQTGEYCWRAEQLPFGAAGICICYYGDVLSVYGNGKLIADQFYYGDASRFYKPEGITSLDIIIQPLQPQQDIYFECERKNGGKLEGVSWFAL